MKSDDQIQPEQRGRDDGEAEPRRRYPRYAVSAMTGRLRRPLPGRLVSWGVDGVDLETHHRLSPGGKIYFRFRESPDEWVVIDGEVTWCRPSADDLFRAGVELQASSPRMASDLLNAFRALAPDSWEMDGNGRYCSPTPVLVMYELEYDLEVRSLSCGGLLVETPVEAPEVDARVELEISLPNRLLRSKARVAYHETAGDHSENGEAASAEDRGTVGVAFVELRRDDETGLQTFLSALSPTTPEDP